MRKPSEVDFMSEISVLPPEFLIDLWCDLRKLTEFVGLIPTITA